MCISRRTILREAAQWYIRHMGCEVMRDRTDRCQFGTMYLAFRPGPAEGGSDGSAVNHIGLSFADLAAKIQELEAAGVTIVTPLREAPGLFKLAFVEDPWGTRIEVVEDPASLGFHHVHLRSANPEATLTWYHTLLGGQRATLKGRLDGLLYGKAWLLATRQTEGRVAPSEGPRDRSPRLRRRESRTGRGGHPRARGPIHARTVGFGEWPLRQGFDDHQSGRCQGRSRRAVPAIRQAAGSSS